MVLPTSEKCFSFKPLWTFFLKPHFFTNTGENPCFYGKKNGKKYETGKKCETEFHKNYETGEKNENVWNTVKSFMRGKNRLKIIASNTISMYRSQKFSLSFINVEEKFKFDAWFLHRNCSFMKMKPKNFVFCKIPKSP